MDNEIILYQPDNSISLEVRVEDETVWLTQQQIADLFGVKQPAISKHLKNIFQSGELSENSVYSILEYTATDGKTYKTKFYNLDAILSVGYRVNSRNATLFRQWANKVLKEYLLKGYSINNRLLELENRIDNRFYIQQKQIDELSDKVELIITSNLRPAEGIFFDGQIWDAYSLINELIRSAQHRIIVIDNYADDSVLTQIDKRNEGVAAAIYTFSRNRQIQQDVKGIINNTLQFNCTSTTRLTTDSLSSTMPSII